MQIVYSIIRFISGAGTRYVHREIVSERPVASERQALGLSSCLRSHGQLWTAEGDKN